MFSRWFFVTFHVQHLRDGRGVETIAAAAEHFVGGEASIDRRHPPRLERHVREGRAVATGRLFLGTEPCPSLLQCCYRRMREGRTALELSVPAERNVGTEAWADCHQLQRSGQQVREGQCLDQHVREGRTVAAGRLLVGTTRGPLGMLSRIMLYWASV